MSALLFACLAAVLTTLGARDQLTVAHLTQRQQRRPAVLLTALAATASSCAAAAWLALQIAPTLAPDARVLFAALLLLAAGAELVLLRSRIPAVAEPTNSLFAAFIVLLAQQLTDAARLLVLAAAVGTAAPLPAGVGGFVGSGLALALGWSMPIPAALYRWRRGGGLLLIAGGLALGTQLMA